MGLIAVGSKNGLGGKKLPENDFAESPKKVFTKNYSQFSKMTVV